MGLFDKVGKGGAKSGDEQQAKQPKQKANKKDKPKKGLFGGKKKDKTLVELMQLEESVAAASIDVVQELADLGESAVRETSEGLLIVAITNETLEAAGLDPSGEEFGSFAEALRSETVESIALAGDLAEGVIGIIPSGETLISLDEFDFAHEIEYKWAVVPFDLEDEDRLTVFDSGVHIGQLVEMANDSDITADVENGAVVLNGGSAGVFADDVSETDVDTGAYAAADTGGLEDDADDDIDWDGDTDEDEDNAPAVVDDADMDGFDVDVDDDDSSEDANTETFDDLDEDVSDAPPVNDDDVDLDLDLDEDADDAYEPEEPEETRTAEESKEIINRVATHAFNNTELGLDIDMTLFDNLFDSLDIAQFDTSYRDDSELQRVISKLRQDANSELKRFREDNVQKLRTKYAASISDIHNNLVEALDHKNATTTYGSKMAEIDNAYEDAMSDLDRVKANRVKQIRDDYGLEREEFGENAKREALSVYDSRHRDKRDAAIQNVGEDLQTDYRLTRDTDRGQVLMDRRDVAKRLFDKATTSLLQKIRSEFQEISRSELRMYDAFRKDMDVYLRKHFADDVLRSKAEAESLRQSHEAEQVRKEYGEMLTAKARQVEEIEQASRDRLRQLEETHSSEVGQIREDYDRRIEREQRDNSELRELLQESNKSNTQIGEQKDKEVEHRMKIYENTIESKDLELKYANERLSKSQRPMIFITAAVASVMIALGIIIGFMVGVGSAPEQPQAPAAEQYGFADEIDYGLPVGVIDFSGAFVEADDVSATASAGMTVTGAATAGIDLDTDAA